MYMYAGTHTESCTVVQTITAQPRRYHSRRVYFNYHGSIGAGLLDAPIAIAIPSVRPSRSGTTPKRFKIWSVIDVDA